MCKILGADQERLFIEMYNLYCSGKECFSEITILQEALQSGADPHLTKALMNQVHFTDRLIREAIDDINSLQCQDIMHAWKAFYLYNIFPIDYSNIELIY